MTPSSSALALHLAGAWLAAMAWSTPALAHPTRAGAARVDITPPTGFPMWGYAARHAAPAEGILDRLAARAVVIESAGECFALVALDLGRPPIRSRTEVIRRRLAEAGIRDVWLAASHSHHGPVLELENWPTPQKPYAQDLEDAIVRAVKEARDNLRPCRYGCRTTTWNGNRNRQSRRPDASVDASLTLVRFEDLNRKPIAILVNYAAHPTMIDARTMQFSGDFSGALAREVEDQAGCPCLYLQGAAGDLSARPAMGENYQGYGRRLARDAWSQVRDLACVVPAGEPWKLVREDLRFPCRLDVANPLVKVILGKAFFPEMVAFYEREYQDGVRPILGVGLLDQNLGLVGLSGEFFCDHALRLRRESRLEHLLVIGYCQDYHQYFPTRRAVEEGGYGTAPPVGMAEVGAGETITGRALFHLEQLRRRPLPANP